MTGPTPYSLLRDARKAGWPEARIIIDDHGRQIVECWITRPAAPAPANDWTKFEENHAPENMAISKGVQGQKRR